MGTSNVKYENLSLDERKCIRDSWLFIRNRLSKLGLRIFSTFFENYTQYSKYKSYFSFSIEDEDELERHGLKVMREISQIVRNSESEDSVLYILRVNALNHRKFHIEPVVYDDFRTCFVKVLKEEFPQIDKIEDIASTWNKGLKLIFQIITDINYDGPITGYSKMSKVIEQAPQATRNSKKVKEKR